MQLRPVVILFLMVACGGKTSPEPPLAPLEQIQPTAPLATQQSSSRCTGAPRVLASQQDGPSRVVVDATSAYWTNQKGGQVMTALLDGGAARALAENQHPLGIAIDATHVYWSNNSPRTGSVMRVSKQGGSSELVADAQATPYGLALDASVLYWVNEAEGTVVRSSLDGKNSKVLASGQGYPMAIATDGRFVFWTHTKAGAEIRKVSVDGGTPITVATEHGNLQSLAVDRSRVYWTNPSRGTVMAAPIDGGPVAELVIDEHYPIHLVVDDANVYWIDHEQPHRRSSSTRIRKAPLGSADAVTLAVASDAVGIAVDTQCVYWTEDRGATGAVMMVAK